MPAETGAGRPWGSGIHPKAQAFPGIRPLHGAGSGESLNRLCRGSCAGPGCPDAPTKIAPPREETALMINGRAPSAEAQEGLPGGLEGGISRALGRGLSRSPGSILWVLSSWGQGSRAWLTPLSRSPARPGHGRGPHSPLSFRIPVAAVLPCPPCHHLSVVSPRHPPPPGVGGVPRTDAWSSDPSRRPPPTPSTLGPGNPVPPCTPGAALDTFAV